MFTVSSATSPCAIRRRPRARKRAALSSVANTAPVMIWMSGGLDKLCNYCNRPWLEFTGRSLEAELATAGPTESTPIPGALLEYLHNSLRST